MTQPLAVKMPVGSKETAVVDFKNKRPLTYGDTLSGTPTVTPTSEGAGTIACGTGSRHGTQVWFTLDAASAVDEGSYLIHVVCATTAGAILVCDCRLLTSNKPGT